ncbi:MAG: hypothetical protein ABL931_12330 [Usitatibacteraceae bacterium]
MVSTPLLPSATYVDTPLGPLKFYTDLVAGKISDLKLAQVKIDPDLPVGMTVSACFAVLVEFSAEEDVSDFQFHCDWESFKGNGSGNSGEGLDAWEWEDNNNLVMVGTEDAEWLNARIPLTPFTSSEYPITMEANKISIRLENLSKGSSCSLHFVVAWNPSPEPHECSCWYAVDVPHKAIAQRVADAG